MARFTSAGSMSKSGSTASELCITSSLMPTVKWSLGWGLASSSNTALTWAGVNSLLARP